MIRTEPNAQETVSSKLYRDIHSPLFLMIWCLCKIFSLDQKRINVQCCVTWAIFPVIIKRKGWLVIPPNYQMYIDFSDCTWVDGLESGWYCGFMWAVWLCCTLWASHSSQKTDWQYHGFSLIFGIYQCKCKLLQPIAMKSIELNWSSSRKVLKESAWLCSLQCV